MSSSTRDVASVSLLNTGKTCDHESCNTIDFLPFKCSHCKHTYCQDHWKPEQHTCNSFDPAAHDRIVPQCPLCSLPVSSKPGQDPNVAMDIHISTNCSVAATKKSRGPTCANARCGKPLLTPITCQVSPPINCRSRCLLTEITGLQETVLHEPSNAHLACVPTACGSSSRSIAFSDPARSSSCCWASCFQEGGRSRYGQNGRHHCRCSNAKHLQTQRLDFKQQTIVAKY